MPIFALSCLDKPNALELRMATRPAHFEFIKGLGPAVRLAGPYLDDKGEMCGSLILIEADDLDAARAIGAQDPYAKAGLFASVDIRPMRLAVSNL